MKKGRTRIYRTRYARSANKYSMRACAVRGGRAGAWPTLQAFRRGYGGGGGGRVEELRMGVPDSRAKRRCCYVHSERNVATTARTLQ